MPSRINPNNIDITYPIAGQDNDTQGFRNNFAGIQSNFLVASSEISALQTAAATAASFVSPPFSGTSAGTQGQIAYGAASTTVNALASFSNNNQIFVTSVSGLYRGAPIVVSAGGTATQTLTATVTWTANTVTTAQQLINSGNVWQVTGNTFAPTFANISANTNPVWTANTVFNYGFVRFAGNTYRIASNAFGASFGPLLTNGNLVFAFTGNTAVTQLTTGSTQFTISTNTIGNLVVGQTYYITDIPTSNLITVGGLPNTSNSASLSNSTGTIPLTVSSAYFYVCTATNTWVRVPMASWTS